MCLQVWLHKVSSLNKNEPRRGPKHFFCGGFRHLIYSLSHIMYTIPTPHMNTHNFSIQVAHLVMLRCVNLDDASSAIAHITY